MTRATVVWLAAGYGGFALGLAGCVARVPGYVLGREQGGISNYGADRRTVAPYTVAYLAFAVGALGAAACLPAVTRRRELVATLLVVLAALLLAQLATTYPYQHGAGWRVLHFTVAIILLGYEVALSVVLLCVGPASPLGDVGLAAQILGGSVCAASLTPRASRLFYGQFLLGSGLLLTLLATLGPARPA